MQTINLDAMPQVVRQVLINIRDRFDEKSERVSLAHVTHEMARHAYANGVSRTAVDAWAAKCIPDLDNAITNLNNGETL